LDLLARRVLDGVAERLARVVPDPPFALHVVGVRPFPATAYNLGNDSTRTPWTTGHNQCVTRSDLQEALLFLPRTERGRDPIHLRQLSH
jgi:hypothetical protein